MMMELLRVKQSGIGGHLFRLAAWIHIHIHVHVQSQLQFTTQQQMQQGSLCFLRFSILLPAFRSDLSLLCLTAVAHKPKWTNIKKKKKSVCSQLFPRDSQKTPFPSFVPSPLHSKLEKSESKRPRVDLQITAASFGFRNRNGNTKSLFYSVLFYLGHFQIGNLLLPPFSKSINWLVVSNSSNFV